MKLREPKTEPPKMTDLRTKVSQKRTFGVELITPLYGGGVEPGKPDQDMPVRAAAIRGQLRFWWRLLKRNRYPKSTDLYNAELAIWGGLSDRGAAASLVELMVRNVSKPEVAACATYTTRDDGTLKGPQWQHRIPGYAMFPGQGELNAGRTGFKERKDPALVVVSLTFTLIVAIRATNGDNIGSTWGNDVLPALRWWASFGGLGARTRRGLGSVKVEALGAVTKLEPVTEEEAAAVGCTLIPRKAVPDPKAAWEQAIKKLRTFRQGLGVGRDGSDPKHPGRSFWPEADSIREITGCHLDRPAKPAHDGKLAQPAKKHAPAHPAREAFPRAAFGLPIITPFKEGPKPSTPLHRRCQFEPDDTALVPVVNGAPRERMATPLILKAMWTGQRYAPIALLLPHDHVTRMGLRIENNPTAHNPNLPKNLLPGQWWPAAAQTAMTTGASPNPLDGRTGDVLADFLDFFRR